jgi:hypothetical protein
VPCSADQFCDYAAGSNCGAADGGGQCKAKPNVCTLIYMPVCGCDGMTHDNACAANGAGTSVAHSGACAAASNDCDPRKVLCKIVQPSCPAGQVPSVSGSCYGSCVSIDTCACGAPAQCPDSNQYTCFMSAGHCGPYV